eukprot:scaffold73267_cov62-Attheya_sp.AAC.1
MSLQPNAKQVRMGGILYCSLFGKINRATMGDELRAGLLSESQLTKAYHRNEGVSISFDDVDDTRLQLSWKDFVLHPSDLLIFSAPFNATRDFYRSFKWISTRALLHQTWRQLYFESFGDAILSFSIYSAYMKRRCELAESSNATLQEKASKYDGIADSISLLTKKNTGILFTFNKACSEAIQKSVTTFQDFSIRLLPFDKVLYYVNLVKDKDCTTDLKRAKLAKERINDPMVEDLVSVVAQVSANDVLVEGDAGDGEFASFTQTPLDETEVDTVEPESSTIMNDGTKVKKTATESKGA